MDQAHHHPVRTSALARHSADRSIAVVCGGGFAGLLAARVLTDAFDRVIVVERDQASRTGLRPGVPQGGHIHALMPGGRAALDRLIPGFSDRLVAAGGTRACLTSTSRRHLGGHWQPRFESELWSVLCTRPLFEQVLYDAVLDPTVHRTEGLEFVDGVTQGLLASDGRIDGVSIGAGAPSVGSDPATVVHADLVVDATGRRSRATEWLAEIDVDVPAETVISGYWGYTSRYYEMPAGFAPDWLTMVLLPTGLADQTRGALIQRQEHGRWLCTLVGSGRDYPPTDDKGISAFLESLPVPDFSDLLGRAKPLGRALGWRRTENRRRHFDQVTNWPDGFLVMGDGLVSLNPVYGQGMSVAALSATQLHLQLAETGDGGARTRGWSSRVQQALAEEVSLAWNIASGADYVVPGASTVPLTPRQDEFLRRWNRANVLASENVEIARLRAETGFLLRGAEWMYDGPIGELLAEDTADSRR